MLVVGSGDEEHTTHMKKILEEDFGACCVLFDTAAGRRTPLAWRDGELLLSGNVIKPKAVYIRTVFISMPYVVVEKEEGGFEEMLLDDWYSAQMAEREWQSLATSCLSSFEEEGVRVANPIRSFDLHFLKVLQLMRLKEAGIPIPLTCCTDDPDVAFDFIKTVGRVVYKPTAGGARCSLFTTKDADRLELIRNAPVLFQEFLEGVPIRVYVVGENDLLACEIKATDVDYRGSEEEIKVVDVPSGVFDMVRKAMRLCGMVYTGADLIRLPDGEFVLLEVNPSPMFLGIQDATGVRIDRALAQFLLGKQE